MTTRITFNKRFVKLILKTLGYKIDKSGYITEKGRKILSVSNKPIKVSEFGGIIKVKGKLYYLKNNIYDIALLSEMTK
jgi:hypothetical protein